LRVFASEPLRLALAFVLEAFPFALEPLALAFALRLTVRRRSRLVFSLRLALSVRVPVFSSSRRSSATSSSGGRSPSLGARLTTTATVCPTLMISPARGDWSRITPGLTPGLKRAARSRMSRPDFSSVVSPSG
jgi:hypothetical protein